MKAAAGILGLVIALGIGLYVYKIELTQGPTAGAPPKQVIDTVGVKNDLISIGQAERLYLASHGSYAEMAQLQQENSSSLPDGARRGYAYAVAVDDGQHFKITATPSDPAKSGWPSLSVDDTMQVTQQ